MCFKEMLRRIKNALFRSIYEETDHLRLHNSLLQDQINSEIDANLNLTAEVHRLKVLNDENHALRENLEQEIIHLINMQEDLLADIARLKKNDNNEPSSPSEKKLV